MTRQIQISSAPTRCCWYKKHIGEVYRCYLDNDQWRIENNPLFSIPTKYCQVINEYSKIDKSKKLYDEFLNTAKDIEQRYGYFTAKQLQDNLDKQVNHWLRKAKNDGYITVVNGKYNFK